MSKGRGNFPPHLRIMQTRYTTQKLGIPHRVKETLVVMRWSLIWLLFMVNNANSVNHIINSASYPQWDEKWVVAYGLQREGLVWLIGVVLCLLAANCRSNCLFADAGNGWPHSALRYHQLVTISHYFRDCKVLLVTIPHVRSATWQVPDLYLFLS